jgi:hypothetical protein
VFEGRSASGGDGPGEPPPHVPEGVLDLLHPADAISLKIRRSNGFSVPATGSGLRSALVPRHSGLLMPGSSFGPGYVHHEILDVEGV